jgi:chitinase
MRASLPDKIIAGYCYGSSEKILESVKNGLNVLIWFQIDITKNEANEPLIQGNLNYTEIALLNNEIKRLGFTVINMICVGGWNAKHPIGVPLAIFNKFKRWNTEIVARPELNFLGFDGIDWDIEGHDNLNSPNNLFKIETLDLMGELSILLKEDGFLVSMAPAESYLDPTCGVFDLDLRHEYEEWMVLKPGFKYHSRNIYAYLLVYFGQSVIDAEIVDTFDFITLQFYESYSHILYNSRIENMDLAVYFSDIITKFSEGWLIDFGAIGRPKKAVRVEGKRFVIGLANGWADDRKTLLTFGKELKSCYKLLAERNVEFKGFALWNVQDEGVEVEGEKLYLAKDIFKILNE